MEIYKEITMDGKNETQELPELFNENPYLVDTWFLMGSPLPLAVILASYLLFVLKVGPVLMKNREPFKLESFMRLYNAVQVVISCFLLYTCTTMLKENGLVPKVCIIESEYNRRKITAAMYYYLLAKFSELLDTIFFVLRKKYKQVSFLHVYHHTLMVIVTWIALKYEPTHALLFLGLVNSFIHMVMYTYYGLSSIPSLTKYLWWKKYITTMQLIQFVLVLVHHGMVRATSDCKPSYIMTFALAMNLILFLYLFGSFYVTTYNIKTRKDTETEITNGLNEMDKKLYQNGKKMLNGKLNDEINYKSASITVNDTYRIRFNLKSNKLANN